MAERKLKYFSTIVREGLVREDLASRLYWSDLPKACQTWRDFEYEHVKQLKKALEYLQISEQEANEGFLNKKIWEGKLAHHKKVVAFTTWSKEQYLQHTERQRERRRRQTQEETMEIDDYVRRRLP